jgi:DNA-binding MarR family transcriptional regulator
VIDDSPATLLHRLVFELDRAADQILRAHLGISYKRALFLFVLQYHGTITQHELALALGYSDPAVSTMLLELAGEGYVQTVTSPEHRRKRLVSLTPKGSEMVVRGKELLDFHFDQLMATAGVDIQQYRHLSEQIFQSLVAKTKQELA